MFSFIFHFSFFNFYIHYFLLFFFSSMYHAFGQRPQRGRSPVEHRGNLSVRPSVRPSPPQPHPQGFVSFGAQIQAVWPKSKQNGPNLGKMGQIQAKWPKSRQNGPNLTRKPEFWSKFYRFGPFDLDSGF